MIIKILLLAAAIAAIYFLLRKISAKAKKEKTGSDETMVECKKCGTYVSSKEAIIKNGHFYCSKECAGV